MKAVLYCVTCVSVVLSGPASQAVPIASDSFATSAGGNDYVPFTSILGQNPTVGASGFGGPWGTGVTASMVPIPVGLAHDLTPGGTLAGHLVAYTIDDTVGAGNARNLSREIVYTPSDGTYYMSMLLRKYAATTRGDLLAGLGRLQDAETSISGIDGTWIGFVDGGISFFWGPDAHITELLSAAEMNVDETYFALMQYDFSTSGPDTVTATIYDGSSVEVAGRPFYELNLDQTMGRFSVITQDFGPIPELDEWRFGTELRDVMVLAGLAGDYNNNGIVDAADYTVWRDALTAGATSLLNDFTPGMVDESDFLYWRDHFGETLGSGSGTGQATVPEPSTLVLLILAAAGCGLRRRRAA